MLLSCYILACWYKVSTMRQLHLNTKAPLRQLFRSETWSFHILCVHFISLGCSESLKREFTQIKTHFCLRSLCTQKKNLPERNKCKHFKRVLIRLHTLLCDCIHSVVSYFESKFWLFLGIAYLLGRLNILFWWNEMFLRII